MTSIYWSAYLTFLILPPLVLFLGGSKTVGVWGEGFLNNKKNNCNSEIIMFKFSKTVILFWFSDNFLICVSKRLLEVINFPRIHLQRLRINPTSPLGPVPNFTYFFFLWSLPHFIKWRSHRWLKLSPNNKGEGVQPYVDWVIKWKHI